MVVKETFCVKRDTVWKLILSSYVISQLWDFKVETQFDIKMTFECESCLQDFEANGSLLRHISHREPCLIHYGERFEKIKYDARTNSKRKWKQSNSAQFKAEYEENKYDIKIPQKRKKSGDNFVKYSYVPVAIRDTFEGEVFLNSSNSSMTRRNLKSLTTTLNSCKRNTKMKSLMKLWIQLSTL